MSFAPVLDFLTDLQANNHRDWMEQNKARYQKAKQIFETQITAFIEAVAAFDEPVRMRELQAKNCTFRINRDIRFSKDKSPYKRNMGAFVSGYGKRSALAGYYLHIEPGGQSFVAGGVYMPPAPLLRVIREEIDYNLAEFEAILHEPMFAKYFSGLEGERLKTTPKGYEANNPAIEWLRMKSFLASYPLSDALLGSEQWLPAVADACKALAPLNRFINRAGEGLEHLQW
ncbi:DUF2461 domain-containing protein [Eisenibacter elegans]|uniref:DUF2461 domain-containing protein n=1 Tax=Eisenibacter elegans TaxID=997 RepID=UPI0004259D9F|nr:DUF2461 domain-containing protein [Eisenibacter elegans]